MSQYEKKSKLSAWETSNEFFKIVSPNRLQQEPTIGRISDTKPASPPINHTLNTITTKHIQKSKLTMLKQEKLTNRRRRDIDYKEGEKVLLSTNDLHWKGTVAPKLTAKYIGPFTVKKVLSSLNYELSLPNSLPIHPVFHVSKLRKFTDSDESFPNCFICFHLVFSSCCFSSLLPLQQFLRC